MTKKEMRLKEEVTRAVLSELTSLLTPENKNAVGKNLQEVAKIMAGYSDFNDRGVIGRYDGTFPLSTATKDNVYLEPKTGKYYRCETNYEGIQISAPNSNFVDLSVLANADRFGNLGNCHNFYFNEGSYDDDNFNILSHKASSHNEFTTVTLKIKKQGNYLLLSHRMAYTEDLETIHNITINNKKVAEAIADDRIYHNSTLFHICNLNLSDTIIFNYSLNTVINEVTPKISIVYLGY